MEISDNSEDSAFGLQAGVSQDRDGDGPIRDASGKRSSSCNAGEVMKGMGDMNANGYDDMSVFVAWKVDDAPLNYQHKGPATDARARPQAPAAGPLWG